MIPKLDDGSALEHPRGVEQELAMFKRVDVTLDQQQIRAALDWQEARTRNVDTVGIVEVLDRGSGSSLELQQMLSDQTMKRVDCADLNDSLAVLVDLRVDDDFELHLLGLHDPLESW